MIDDMPYIIINHRYVVYSLSIYNNPYLRVWWAVILTNVLASIDYLTTLTSLGIDLNLIYFPSFPQVQVKQIRILNSPWIMLSTRCRAREMNKK